MREELLKSVTKDTSLNQCLEFARCVEGNMPKGSAQPLGKSVFSVVRRTILVNSVKIRLHQKKTRM